MEKYTYMLVFSSLTRINKWNLKMLHTWGLKYCLRQCPLCLAISFLVVKISGFFGNASITNKQTKIELKWKYQYSRYSFCCMIKVTHKMILLFFFMNQTDTWMNLNMFLKLCENALWSILCYMKLRYICSFKSTNCANVFLLKHCKGIFIFGNCLCLVWKYLFK